MANTDSEHYAHTYVASYVAASLVTHSSVCRGQTLFAQGLIAFSVYSRLRLRLKIRRVATDSLQKLAN